MKASEPVPVDLADVGVAVVALQKAISEMRGKVKDKLIVLMLNDMTGIAKRDIKKILDAVPQLAKTYVAGK